MKLGSTIIDATFAEAFRMRYARLIVTAHDEFWLRAAVAEFTGYASSIIACDAEAGVENWLSTGETPDRRPGAAILAFGFSAENLGRSLLNRTGQCLMTCPTTAVYDGLSQAAERVPLGKSLRFFGDGFQKSKLVGPQRFWRIPVMDGEFLVAESLGIEKGIGGGNIILQSADLDEALSAARHGAEAVAALAGTITPFPGGVARSGSKVGSRYKKLKASTSDPFCPTLRGRVESRLHPAANFAYEIVIDGTDEQAVGDAMAAAMRAAAGPAVPAISAGNYGGKLGKFHFHLHELLKAD
ncbi:MAG TPA: formylmethanofuran--tetrahydromethanopterin N-formyltransferase [Pirellulales bacterium]|jgi:formylmethanofuran--tetrahydromethanopterin N-formyltransferase|nr:formylmethanofuran--tetrahydromethanopterin N-formyltransferase [Pirellulales bacterium]